MNSGSASFLNAHLLMIQRSKQKEDCLYFFLCIVLYSFPLTFATQKYVFLVPLSLEKNRSPRVVENVSAQAEEDRLLVPRTAVPAEALVEREGFGRFPAGEQALGLFGNLHCLKKYQSSHTKRPRHDRSGCKGRCCMSGLQMHTV